MNDVLRKIIAETRATLERNPLDATSLRTAAETTAAAPGRHRFRAAVSDPELDVHLIAEIKSASPSAGTIVDAPDVEGIASAYAAGGAAAISVVTEPEFFRGDRAWLRRATGASGLPVIMKDFIVEESQIFRGVAEGADAVLLLGSVLDGERLRQFLAILDALGRDALVEVHDERELDSALDAGATIVGVNNRNLRDFSVDLGVSERLGQMIPGGVVRVAESGIHQRTDIERLAAAGFSAFLVGESLLRQDDRAMAVRRLVGGDA